MRSKDWFGGRSMGTRAESSNALRTHNATSVSLSLSASWSKPSSPIQIVQPVAEALPHLALRIAGSFPACSPAFTHNGDPLAKQVATQSPWQCDDRVKPRFEGTCSGSATSGRVSQSTQLFLRELRVTWLNRTTGWLRDSIGRRVWLRPEGGQGSEQAIVPRTSRRC